MCLSLRLNLIWRSFSVLEERVKRDLGIGCIELNKILVINKGIHNRMPGQLGTYFNGPCTDPIYSGTRIKWVRTLGTRF